MLEGREEGVGEDFMGKIRVCVCVRVCKWSRSVYTYVSVQQGRSAETQVPADGAAESL